MKISVVIPCYNRPDWLRKTVQSIINQGGGYDEIITVYQSEQEDAELKNWLAKEKVKYIYLENPSTPKARNLGVKSAIGDIIIFFDDDVELLPGCLDAHVKAYVDDRVVGVAGRVITMRDGKEDSILESGTDIGVVDKLGRIKGDQQYNSLAHKRGRITPLGCNMSVRKKVIEEAGYYDETYIGNAMREETDLAIRALRFGEIVFEPKAAVRHFLAKSGGTRQKTKKEWYGDYFFNEGYFIAKFVPRQYYLLARLRLSEKIIKYTLKYARGFADLLMPYQTMRRAAKMAREGRR